MKKIWFISLCALLILAMSFGFSVPLRVAIGANAIVILIDIIRRIRRLHNGTEEEKNQNIIGGEKSL